MKWYQKIIEAWWILTGKWSLHRAWQDGLDYGISKTVHKVVAPSYNEEMIIPDEAIAS